MGACSSCVFKTCYILYAKTCIGRILHKKLLQHYKKVNGEGGAHTRMIPFIFGDLLIQPIPVGGSNYTYLVGDILKENFVLVDVGDPAMFKKPIFPDAILTTHKHWDHSYGNRIIRNDIPGVPVYGGAKDNVPGATVKVKDGDILKFGRLVFTAFWTPGHTKGHICYLLDGALFNTSGHIFTGDHLMLGGCGANFECNITTMIRSLERIKSFPDDTCVWPGHELGLDNIMRAVFLDQGNTAAWEKLAWVANRRRSALSTCPSTIGEEKKYNPFLRTRDETFISHLGVKDVIKDWKKPVDPEIVGVMCYQEILRRVSDDREETKKKRKEIMQWAINQDVIVNAVMDIHELLKLTKSQSIIDIVEPQRRQSTAIL